MHDANNLQLSNLPSPMFIPASEKFGALHLFHVNGFDMNLFLLAYSDFKQMDWGYVESAWYTDNILTSNVRDVHI